MILIHVRRDDSTPSEPYRASVQGQDLTIPDGYTVTAARFATWQLAYAAAKREATLREIAA